MKFKIGGSRRLHKILDAGYWMLDTGLREDWG
jgi:hypothetical protein